LQRSYDQLLHDIALPKKHVVFALDRAGLVPSDGPTHQGLWDIAYALHVPNSRIYTPFDESPSYGHYGRLWNAMLLVLCATLKQY